MTSGNGNGTQHTNWDERREQLSAYLDGELAGSERKLLEAHLVDCTACQRELAELRQVRKLLRALPTPALPRSFTLPVAEHAPARSARTVTTARAPRPSGRLARAAQWTGGLAASVGLLLILSSALIAGAGPHGAGSATSRNAPAASSSHQTANGPAGSTIATHPPEAGVQGNGTQTPQASSSAAPVISPAATPAQPADTGSSTFGPDNTPSQGTSSHQQHPQYGAESAPASSSTALGLTGAGLAGGGALLFIGGSIGRRRKRR